MEKIFFIGRFPPPYGGATIKCKMLCEFLEEHFEVEKFDTELKNKNKYKFLLMLILFLLKNKNRKGVICIHALSLFKLTKYINLVNKSLLMNISVFINGGNLANKIIQEKIDINMLNKFKVLYVESNIMKQELEDLGIRNSYVLPNCRRFRKGEFKEFDENEKIKCIFASRVDTSKGVFKMLEAFQDIDKKKFALEIFGPIEEDIKDEFVKLVNLNNIVSYKGIIEKNEDIYDVLNKNDVLIFPTDYQGEGYPGIITEARIVGIPIISSEFPFSREIINDKIDGIIIKINNSENIRKELEKLYLNKKHLSSMKRKSYDRRNECFIEAYTTLIKNNLK